MHHAGFGLQFEHFSADMRQRASALTGVTELARISPQVLDEFVQIVGGHGGMNGYHVGRDSNQRDRHKVFLRPGQFGRQVGIANVVRRVGIEQGVAVRVGSGDSLVSHVAAAAATVVNDHRLGCHLGQ